MRDEIDPIIYRRLHPYTGDGWRAATDPVGPAMAEAGPDGHMEFSADGRWRMFYADGTLVAP